MTEIDLTKYGYKMWEREINGKNISEKWQKKIDLDDYPENSLCNVGNNIYINLIEYTFDLNGTIIKNLTISITQGFEDVVSNIQFYSIKEKKLVDIGIRELEDKMIEMAKLSFSLNS